VNVDAERQARWVDVRVCRVIRALRHSAAMMLYPGGRVIVAGPRSEAGKQVC